MSNKTGLPCLFIGGHADGRTLDVPYSAINADYLSLTESGAMKGRAKPSLHFRTADKLGSFCMYKRHGLIQERNGARETFRVYVAVDIAGLGVLYHLTNNYRGVKIS